MAEETEIHDVFLSYNSKENVAVQALKSKLQACDIDCWLDSNKLNLGPKDSPVAFQLHGAIQHSTVFVAIIGSDLAGPWQAREIATALRGKATEVVGFRDRIILVCLPGLAKEKRESLRDALDLNSAIVFESHLDEEVPFRRLLNEIKGEILRTQPEGILKKENPYKGLASFQEEDYDQFFGRDDLIRDLIGHIQTALDKGTPRLFILFGASGSGKSSLARAGVVAWLKKDEIIPGSKNWDYATLIPSDQPLYNLAKVVAKLRATTDAKGLESAFHDDERTLDMTLSPAEEGNKFVLLVDQFEEIFTLCHDNDVRRAFIDNLLFAASLRNGPGIVILTVRSDFHADLVDWCGIDHPKYTGCLHSIGSVRGNELRAAIEQPAQMRGVKFMPELLERLLGDTEARDLPLLQDVLFKLWSYRRAQEGSAGEIITLDAYKTIGGVRDALARRADAIYQGFSQDEQAIVRNIFLNLLQINEDAPVTRQRMLRDDLIPHGIEKEHVEAIIDQLVKERLLVTDAGKVEIIHEALVKNWPALEIWLNEYGKDLKAYQQIKEAARRWEDAKRDDADVYSGHRLANALDWQERNAKAVSPLRLSASVKDFLHAGAKKEQAAERQRKLLEARRIMLEAQAVQDVQFDLRLLLSATLGQDYPEVSESLSALLSTTLSHPHLVAFLRGHTDGVRYLALSPDGHTLASASKDKTVILWDVRYPQAPRKIQALQGHTGWVNHLALSPDGHTLASASDDKTVILWDVRAPRAPQKIQALEDHTDEVNRLAFSRDGHTLASASKDTTVILWDMRNPRVPRKIQALEDHTDEVHHLAFSPNGRTLASASKDKTVILWDVRNPRAPRKIQALEDHTDEVNRLAFSPYGHILALASVHKTVILWDVRDPRAPRKIRALEDYTGGIWHLAFSPDGHTLASASGNKAITLWDVSAPEKPWKIRVLEDHTDWVLHLAFSPDGHTLASASTDKTVILWDVRDPRSPRKIRALQNHTGEVHHLAFSPNGHTLVSASSDKTVILWDVRDPQAPQTIQALEDHTGNVHHFAFSPDGHTLASVDRNDNIILRDVHDPRASRKIRVLEDHRGSVSHLVFSPDGHTLASASKDKTVILWDVHDPQVPRKIQTLKGHTDKVIHLAFSPDGYTLASASDDKTVILWDVRGPRASRKIRVLEDHTGGVWHLALSPDGYTLASTGSDKTVILWDVRDPQASRKIRVLESHTDWVRHLAFSPDGHTLASASSDKTVILWDVRDPQAPRKTQTLQGHTDKVWHLAFSPDNHTLASASGDKTVILWDVHDPHMPRKIQALKGHTEAVWHLAFSPNGYTLTSAGGDDILIWDINPASLAHKACRIAGRNMTYDEWRQYMGDKDYRKICERFPLPDET
jgi:WD40 repeat protein